MINPFTRIKWHFEKIAIRFRESNYDFLRLHLGTNSIFISLILLVCIVISYKSDVLNWSYLKGINDDLSFFIGLFSILFGVGFYTFWQLGEKSVYTIHLAKNEFMPKGVNTIFSNDNFSFGISSRIKTKSSEFSSIVREIFCIGIFCNLALITLDNGGFDKLISFPSEIMQSSSGYCPVKDENAEEAPPKEGCELIIRAYKLGYAKNLGICEPETIDPDKMEICEKRREDEPYFHHMSRMLVSSVKKQIEFFENNKVQQIKDKFNLQLQELEVLKDYRAYAISASPRASHHIWTNLPYPENDFVQKYRQVFQPNHCIEQFQNQTNTVRVEDNDERKNSKLLEHVYGQLLFNPKSKLTVGSCKEYEIHWNSQPNICESLAINPEQVLQEEGVLAEVQLVLERHDIANVMLTLDEEIQELKQIEVNDSTASNVAGEKEEERGASASEDNNVENSGAKVGASQIAKAKEQIRKKNQLVSFQCFMQAGDSAHDNVESNVNLNGTNFLVRTRYFQLAESKGESQIAMYRDFSKLLEDRFHYSQLTSRSDINIAGVTGDAAEDVRLLEEPTYLFSRLEKLENVDIFLGNNWVLEREDLLDVYPYHLHLQNYVNSFRAEYQESRGRL
jgi:hypothetical protein